MAVKRASLRGKGASIFFGGDDEEQVESQELANSATNELSYQAEEPSTEEANTSRLSESGSTTVGNNQTAKASNSRTPKLRKQAGNIEFDTESVSDLQTDSVSDYDSFTDAEFDDTLVAQPYAPTRASARVANSDTSEANNYNTSRPANRGQTTSSRLTNSDTSQGDNYNPSPTAGRRQSTSSALTNSDTSQADNYNTPSQRQQADAATSRLSNSSASAASNFASPAGTSYREPSTSRVANSGTSQAGNFAAPSTDTRSGSRGNRNLQSSTVNDLDTGRVTDYSAARRGTQIADESRADYLVGDVEDSAYQPLRRPTFSEFYTSGETHYLMLEPLATRLTSEQMDRLSSLERRIHQGRRRKEPRVTKNSIIRALLEATFDLDLDTRDINSETELVNRFREALHLAALSGELRGR